MRLLRQRYNKKEMQVRKIPDKKIEIFPNFFVSKNIKIKKQRI